ncbi:hypothetical protein ATCC90586_003221 [Pythium insidiosum]|nr:hypothetical protein ATCC90586_003221 [Pythium insidiosum]
MHAEEDDAYVGEAQAGPEPPSRLRRLVAKDATAQCLSCMFLPCICPDEDDGSTSAEGTSPVDALHAEAVLGTGNHDGAQGDERDGDDNDERDALGRVRLPGDSSGGEDVWVAAEIKRHLRPHQIEGVRFIHGHTSRQKGCILADYMGLGKTLQVITAVHSFLTDHELHATDDSDAPRPSAMVLCPAICIPNWEAEFAKWLEPASRERVPVLAFDAMAGKGTAEARLRVLRRWRKQGGVLLMGYEMFRSLLNPTVPTASLDRDPSIQICTRITTSAETKLEITSSLPNKASKATRREFERLLCAPGADLVVLDEGHRMKDPTSLLCQSVARISTPRRVVLTGYPVQNSLSEYWCMVNFARDGFLGSYDAFRAQYERPILEGDAARSQELVDRLRDVVLRRGQQLLRTQLPPKREWILECRLSPLQHRLYCAFLASYGNGGGVAADLLTAYAALLQVMNHPDIIYDKLTQHPGANDDDNDAEIDGDQDLALQDGGWSWEPEAKRRERRLLAAEQSKRRRQKIADRLKAVEWARPTLVPDAYEPQVLAHSGKMAVLMAIVEASLAVGDKVVVFSQSVPTLQAIRAFLDASAFNPNATKSPQQVAAAPKRRRLSSGASRRDPAGILRRQPAQPKSSRGAAKRKADDVSSCSVSPGAWYLQIDGSTPGAKRMEYIQAFSSATSAVKVLLVSTRAGAEGINLHAANRLVLFDVSWNPSNDHQSMCRSHRIGQAKTVHVYRLVSTGTMERMIYEQQQKKVDLSTTVVDDDVARLQSATAASASATAAAPYSGFLQSPPVTCMMASTSSAAAVDEELLQGDEVLSTCLQNAGQRHRRHATSTRAPPSTSDGSGRVVGVDVTAHTEERRVAAAGSSSSSSARSKSDFRVRFYVELVVGSPRDSHTRLGFSGTFKALLRLHRAFEALFDEHHRLKTARESAASARTSVSSASSTASSSLSMATDGVPKMLPFPVAQGLAGKLLVRLEPQRAESDEKTRARIDALFAYYTQLFNSEERDLYLQYVQSESERDATDRRSDLSNQRDSELEEDVMAVATEVQSRRRSVGRFLGKLFSRHHHAESNQVEAASALKSDRERLDKSLEFRAPVHVHKPGGARSRRPF